MQKRTFTVEQRHANCAREKARQLALTPEQRDRQKKMKAEALKRRLERDGEEVRRRQREASRRFRLKHPEKVRESGRKWVRNNTQKARQNVKNWRTKNWQRWRELVKASEKRHPERHRQQLAVTNSRRRARLAACEGNHTPAEWRAILKAHNHRCYWCGCGETEENPITKDHLIALSKGGTNYASNLVPACRKHNATKRARDPIEFARSLGMLL